MSGTSITTAAAMEQLSKAIKEDSDYAWSWQCNLAMAAHDEGLDRASANRAASRFMQTAFSYDVTKHPRYAETQVNHT